MAVRFILGRSGTGKTGYCIDSIAKALLESKQGRRLIFLVPEQASYQAERAILSNKQILGYSSTYPSEHQPANTSGLSILSFDRLQYLFLGRNTARQRLSKIGRQMIIARILNDRKDKLKIFGRMATFAGFCSRMAQIIAELQRFAKEPEDIDQLILELDKDEHNRFSALKFSDIALVLKEYLRFVEGRFLDPDRQLNLARQAVADSEFFRGAEIWVDGFAGFTTSELAIITELLKAAAYTNIALCLDTEKLDLKNPDSAKFKEMALFNPTEKTYADLIQIIKGCKLTLAEPVILNDAVRFKACPPLGHIEANIFQAKPPVISAQGRVRILAAQNMRAEVKFVAGQIVDLVRKEGFRYRDIAVIAPDLSRYEHYIKAYFDDYSLPFFIDSRQSLRHHPAVVFISSALRAAVCGFSNCDIFEYLKSGLAPIDSYDVDLLENYCLAFGIGSRDWMSADSWSFDDKKPPLFDEKLVNQIRKSVIKPLLVLHNKLCNSENSPKKLTPRLFTSIIFDFLQRMGLPEKINLWIQQATEKKDYAAADEHRQFYDRLLDIFDELCEAFEPRQLSCDDYISIIGDAFSQLTLAMIPPALDEIIVGSIERSRHPDLKVAFLIGTTQKNFPGPVNYEGILSDEDREAAEAVEFELAAGTGKTLAQRQYLTYIAFTRPSDFLFITYPALDDKDRPVVRSQFIDDIESLFDDVTEQRIVMHDSLGAVQDAGISRIDFDKIYTRTELEDFLCVRARRDYQIKALVERMSSDAQLAQTAYFVKRALAYRNCAELDKSLAEELLGRRLQSSASKLAAFADCPYKYFARYVLKLKERKEFKLEPLDLGRFYHRVLDELFKKLKDCGKNFGTVSAEQLKEILETSVAKIIEADLFIKGFCRHSSHNTFIIASACQILQGCVIAVSQMVRAGSFQPVLSELAFGKTGDGLGEYKLMLNDGRALYLNGRIDRIDVADIDGRKAAVVFDYKRRGASFSWSKFYHGLDMQLAIYMLAVKNSEKKEFTQCDIAGAFYMPLERGVKKGRLNELEEKKGSFDYKARGVFNGDYAFIMDKQALKDSSFYNFYVKKDGQPYGKYGKMGALKPDDFQKVLGFAEKKIAELAGKILEGNIDIKPYKLGSSSACTFCKYKSLCRFDWQINDYNFLEPHSKISVLDKV